MPTTIMTGTLDKVLGSKLGKSMYYFVHSRIMQTGKTSSLVWLTTIFLSNWVEI
jgi:hypothetical protein